MRVDEFISRLENVKRDGDGWRASCPSPAHERGNRSAPALRITEGMGGEILIRCHAGCPTEAVCESLGLELKDLFPEKEERVQRIIETTYDYVDESGVLLYQVVRYKPKSFSQRRPDGNGGWVDKLGDVRRVLYRLPEVLKAISEGTRIWVVEGEKDVESLRAIGEVATTNVGGASSWKDEYTEFLSEAKTVIVVADRDGPGIKRAEKIAAALKVQGVTVVICQAAVGKDISDHLAAGCGLDELERLNPEKKADGIVLEKFSSIRAAPPEWVKGLEGFVPFRAITLLAGEQGTNKSTFACHLAALITLHYDSDVMYITTEGDPGVEVKPRLLAAGADIERCHFVRRAIDGFEGIVSFPQDIRELEAEVKRTGTRLIVIDPVLAHVDVEDTHNDNSIRTALAPLQQMAQRQNLIVLLIAHINKDRSTDPFKRVGGSKGLTGVARSNLMMGKLYDGHELRAVASFKSSWADPPHALVYRVDTEYVPEIDSHSIKTTFFQTKQIRASSLLSENRGEAA